MMPSPEHLIIAPVLIPLVAGALMLFYDDRQRRAKITISLISVALLVAVAVELVLRSKGDGPSGTNDMGIYLLGDWPTPFAIVLVLDRLSAMMLLLTAFLAVPSLIFAAARWHSQGQHFHSLFQFLLMGLNGAFLTGDLFNLFVFFEVFLAASYGLMLHGSGQARVRAGLHYIAINLVASLMFLIGVAIIYGVAGTLNMADLAMRLPRLSSEDRPMIHAAAAILGLAFLVKAGMWPLSFWLPSTYMAAAAPVAAMFSILTKVGVYVVLRISTLLFGAGIGASAGFGSELLLYGGMATVGFGLLGVLASQGLPRMAGFSVLISSGTILAVTGLVISGGGPGMLAGALYYMVVSTIAISAFFLLIELIERGQGSIATVLALTADVYGQAEDEFDDTEDEIGLPIPATMTILGICFAVCVILLAGLPPLGGFLGKFAMLSGLLNPLGLARPAPVPGVAWVFTGLLIFSGLATLVAMVRVGIHTFWATADDSVPKVLAIEIVPVVLLLSLTGVMTVKAEPVMRYMDATAQALSRPEVYIYGVMYAERTADQGIEALQPGPTPLPQAVEPPVVGSAPAADGVTP